MSPIFSAPLNSENTCLYRKKCFNNVSVLLTITLRVDIILQLLSFAADGLVQMEMDYNLKKLANFFKFFLCVLVKLLKPDL